MSKKTNAFIIDPSYIITTSAEDETKKQAIVTFYVRLEDGRNALVKLETKPFFFIKKSDQKKAKELITDYEVDFEKSGLCAMGTEEEVVKALSDIPANIPKIRQALEKEEIECFEADIRFAYRSMMDTGVQGSMSIEGEEKEPSEKEKVDVIYENPRLGPASKDYAPQISIFSFDIESDKHSGQIYCLSSVFIGPDGKERTDSFIISKEKVERARYFDTEKEMIESFRDLIKELNPDIITGWNVIDFDLKLLQERANKHKITLDIGRNASEMRLRIESSFFKDSHANITGRVVLDGIALMKSNFIRLPNYKLATAAREFTDNKKLIEETGKAKYEEITRLFNEDKEALLKYNLEDARLVIEILENSGALKLTISRSLLVGMPLDRVSASIASLDSLYLRELHDRGFVAPSVKGRRRDSEGMGGFVMQSKPGIYDYVIVCDFKSLYPSIMRTFNIDPMMFVDEEKAANSKEGELIESPNGAHFKREQGIIPGIIEKFWAAREKARVAGDETARFAIKIHMNSMYGVLASPNCRFFNRKVGNAITGYAQHFIKMTAEEVGKKGFEVIYGDTDSIFIDLKTEDYEESQKLGKEIEKSVNTFLKEHIRKEYDLDSYLELEFEKTFIRFVMPTVRGSDKGAKKRYAGLVRKSDGTEEISFTGLEMVRRDWTDLAKDFQHELYKLVFAKKEVTAYVRKYIEDLRAGKLDDKCVYRKALRKDVEEYTKITPAHVKAAMKIDGELESNIIEYVLTSDGPEPVQNVQHAIDYEHYIDKQLKPIADSLLGFFGTSFDDQMKGNSQSSLFDY